MSNDFVYAKRYRQVFFIKLISSHLHTLEAERHLQSQCSHMGICLSHPQGEVPASTWNPACSRQHGKVQR